MAGILQPVSVDNVTLQQVAGVVSIKALGVGAAQLAASAVTNAKVDAAAAIALSKIAGNPVAGLAASYKAARGRTLATFTSGIAVIATGLTTVTGFAANFEHATATFMCIVEAVSGGDVTVHLRDGAGNNPTNGNYTISWAAVGT